MLGCVLDHRQSAGTASLRNEADGKGSGNGRRWQGGIGMTLIRACAADRLALADGDPLPPDDRVVADQRHALADRYRDHRPRLLGWLRRRTDPDRAEDMVQQIFVRLAQSDMPASIITAPHSYFRRAATNALCDDARRTGRHPERIGDPDDHPAPTDPVAVLEARDMLNRIEAAMLRLKPRTREIFLAHRIDGYSYAEIAARTGLTVKGVEKQMSRAIAQLDHLLGPR